MNIPTQALAHPYYAVALALLAIATLALAARRLVGRTPTAVICAAIAAAACTAYSADTSWRFAAHHLGMTSAAERAAMFAAGELALFAVAMMARQNLRTIGAPGTPSVLVWVITGVQVVPAFAESGFWGGIVRAFIGPILAALLWHLAMGIELRHSRPDAGSQSLPAVIAREIRERLLSRLGLAVRDRSAEQITRDRATVQAASLAARLAEMTVEQRDSRSGRRTARRLSVAVGRAQAGARPEQRTMLLELLAARRHAASLATVDLPSPWETTTPVTTDVTGPSALPRVIAVPIEVPIVPAAVTTGKTTAACAEPVRQPVIPVPPAPAQLPDWMTTGMTTQVTTVAASQPVRQVVTSAVTPTTNAMTEAEIRKAARGLNRQAMKDTGRPVTIDRLRAELGLSRRDATALRRTILADRR
jgi:hypothetical protein